MYTYRIALRSRVPRTALAASGSRCYHTHRSPDARKLTTAGYSSLPNQRQPPRPNTGGDRSVVYIGGALAATGALWYYFTSTEMAGIEQKREGPGSQAQPTMGDATRRARDSAQVALQSAEADYQDVKAGAQRKVREAREEARAGIESGKQYYDEEKDQLGQHAYEARTAAEKKADAAKAGWWNWLGWGRSQTKEVADELKRRANETQEAWNARFEEAKRQAERKGEDIMQRAGETEEDFRRRIAKAIWRG